MKKTEEKKELPNIYDEETSLKKEKENKKNEHNFTIMQKLSLILFGCSFIIFIVGYGN